MKIISALALSLLFARAAAHAGQGLSAIVLASNAPAPAPGPASGPAAGPAAALAGLRVTFEIKNYNYYDLTKETCPQTDEADASSKKKDVKIDLSPAKEGIHNAIKEIATKADEMGEDLAEVAGVVEKDDKAEKPPWMEDKAAAAPKKAPSKAKAPPVEEASSSEVDEIGEDLENMVDRKDKSAAPPWMKDKEAGASLLETSKSSVCVIEHKSLAAIHAKSDSCKTVMDVFRSAIEEVVRDVIKCALNSAVGSAPAAVAQSPATLVPLPPQAFLQSAPAPAPATAPAPAGPPDPAIFVTFTPGKEVGSGRTVIVEITFTDKPNNGIDDVAGVKPLIKQVIKDGTLMREMKAALEIVTGLMAKIGKVKMSTAAVDAWNVKKCEGHVKNIVGQFSHHYTREQVPMAMFNECTNFMTRMSFSNDYVLDRTDTIVCRQTTAKFAKHWNYGEKAKPEDFELMCVRSCEAKFGKNAPQCNVEAGDELASQPLL
jgi:hypothetical protein